MAALAAASDAADAPTLEEIYRLLQQQQEQIEAQQAEIEGLHDELERVRKGRAMVSAPDRPSARPAPGAGGPVRTDATSGDATVGAAAEGAAEPRQDAPVEAPSQEPGIDDRVLDKTWEEKLRERLSVSSYGVINYFRYDWETDKDKRDEFDAERLVFGAKYRPIDSLTLEAEVEFEHLGTGSTVEFDKDEEFGEFETEVERGGEVEVEEMLLEWEPWSFFGLKAGYFNIPIGLNNFRHHPEQYFTTTRFQSEVTLLPDTWNEMGIEAFGRYDLPREGGHLEYRLAYVSGLDSTAFSSANWVKPGHQTRFETINADDLAIVGRLDYHPVPGVLIGGSGYYGNTKGNRPKPDLDVNADVTIWDVHGEYKRGPLEIRGLYLRGHLSNSAAVSLANLQLSNNLNVKRTPVGKEAYAAFVEVGLHIDDLTRYWLPGFIPFYRFDAYDTMDEVQAPVIRNPFYDRNVHTFGADYRPFHWLVFKAQYSHLKRNVDSSFNEEDTISVGMGYDVSF